MAERLSIGNASAFSVGALTPVKVNGVSLLVTKIGDEYCVIKNQCSHMNLPLGNGRLEGDTITCRWHGSKFNVCTGENIDWVQGVAGVRLPNWSRKLIAMGKKPAGLQTYPVIEEDGVLYVEL